MVRILRGFQLYRSDVGEIRTTRLLVDWTVVHPGVGIGRAVDGVDVNDWKRLEQHLGLRFDELATAPVPTCSLQEQAVHVHALLRWLADVILVVTCHVVS